MKQYFKNLQPLSEDHLLDIAFLTGGVTLLVAVAVVIGLGGMSTLLALL
jgi:hypothetical protein